MFELARLVICALVAAALQIATCATTAGAAPVSTVDPSSSEPLPEALHTPARPVGNDPSTSPPAGGSIAGDGAEPFPRDPIAVPSVDRLFDSREFELSVTEDEYKSHSDPASCLYPDNSIRGLRDGAEDCHTVPPAGNEPEHSSLPFLALCGWALVILIIAGLHRFYRNWRVWQWLRRMRALGLIPKTAISRRHVERRARRSSSSTKPRSRRYAG